VKRIIGNAGGKPHVAVRDAKMEGYEFADFEYLEAMTPFPVTLFGARIPWMHQVGIPQLFGSEFTKTTFFKEYTKGLAQLDIKDTERRVGLVFRWPGISRGGGAMVLHNYPVMMQNIADPDLREERGTRIVRPFGNPVVIYVIEAFQDFLLTVGTDWYQE